MSSLLDQRPEPVMSPNSRQRVPGEIGVWALILGDMTVFAYLFANYLHSRARDVASFRASQHHLSQTMGTVNTLLLLVSSLLVVLGVHSVAADKRALARRSFALAAACGIGFAVNKFIEYRDHLQHGFGPHTDNFWMYYYILTGTHLFHLTIGLVILGALIALCRPTAGGKWRTVLIEGGACFWHMVDLLWIVLFALFYLA